MGLGRESFSSDWLTDKNGDNISSEQKLISVSDIVDTNLGKGRYWIIEVKYLNQLDILVGKQNIQFLGYKK